MVLRLPILVSTTLAPRRAPSTRLRPTPYATPKARRWTNKKHTRSIGGYADYCCGGYAKSHVTEKSLAAVTPHLAAFGTFAVCRIAHIVPSPASWLCEHHEVTGSVDPRRYSRSAGGPIRDAAQTKKQPVQRCEDETKLSWGGDPFTSPQVLLCTPTGEQDCACSLDGGTKSSKTSKHGDL